MGACTFVLLICADPYTPIPLCYVRLEWPLIRVATGAARENETGKTSSTPTVAATSRGPGDVDVQLIHVTWSRYRYCMRE